MTVHDELFHRFQSASEIYALVGQTEDLHLECKRWPDKDKDAQSILAKALCGFANADGGVIIIGMDARSRSKHDPDQINEAVPVTDAVAVKARIEALVGDLVEPRIQGVQTAAVPGSYGPPGGFVIVSVPPTDGPPCRLRKDRDFYQRITSGTYPMEYFQIADMFGKRHRPILSLFLEEGECRRNGQTYEREFVIGVENSGRAVAKFPSLRFDRVAGINVNHYGIDGNGGFGLPRQPTEPEIVVFGGTLDGVVYPGTVLKLATLDQRAKASECTQSGSSRQRFYLDL